MLRVLPPTFKPVNKLICCKTGLMWVVKRATASLFISFCSNVARQVALFLLPVFPYLKKKTRSVGVSEQSFTKVSFFLSDNFKESRGRQWVS